MRDTPWLQRTTAAFRLMIATSWLAPEAWRERQEAAIREAIAAGPDWVEYLRLVDRHRIPALGCAALNRLSTQAIPKRIQQELQKRSDACRMQAVRHCLRLAEILKMFNRLEIPVMPLKGPLLSLELYGDVGLRQSRDLDLMVPLQDFSQARICMESTGWRLDKSYSFLTPRQWASLMTQDHHLGFVHSQTGCLLELHWRNLCDAPGRDDARWEKSTAVAWQGFSYQAMHPIDQLLYLCIHGGRHSWFRAKWLGDLARIHAQGKMNWTEAFHQSQNIGQEKVLLASLRLLQEAYALPLPELPEGTWETLPSLLVDRPLDALDEQENAGDHGPLRSLRTVVHALRYDWLVLPQQRWRSLRARLFNNPLDFQIIHIPDRFFWAYLLLRPFLWFWRQVLGRGPRVNSR
jgi:hypothetical protein